jgi:hypothetical protein
MILRDFNTIGLRNGRRPILLADTSGGSAMNSFHEHHSENSSFHDRILLNGLLRPFQQPKRVAGFFSIYRQIYIRCVGAFCVPLPSSSSSG